MNLNKKQQTAMGWLMACQAGMLECLDYFTDSDVFRRSLKNKANLLKQELERINYMFYAGVPGKVSGMDEEGQKQDFQNYYFIAEVFARLMSLPDDKKVKIIDILSEEMSEEEKAKYQEIQDILKENF